MRPVRANEVPVSPRQSLKVHNLDHRRRASVATLAVRRSNGDANKRSRVVELSDTSTSSPMCCCGCYSIDRAYSVLRRCSFQSAVQQRYIYLVFADGIRAASGNTLNAGHDSKMSLGIQKKATRSADTLGDRGEGEDAAQSVEGTGLLENAFSAPVQRALLPRALIANVGASAAIALPCIMSMVLSLKCRGFLACKNTTNPGDCGIAETERGSCLALGNVFAVTI